MERCRETENPAFSSRTICVGLTANDELKFGQRHQFVLLLSFNATFCDMEQFKKKNYSLGF